MTRPAAAVILVAIPMSVAGLTGCVDPGPMDQLRDTTAAFSVPDEMVPTTLSPWKGYDWDEVDLDAGGTALVWEGPRGIDNDTAWLVSGWQVDTPSGGSAALAEACAVWEDFVVANAPDPQSLEARMARCSRTRWGARSFGVSWDTVTDSVPVRVGASLQRSPDDAYRMRVGVSER